MPSAAAAAAATSPYMSTKSPSGRQTVQAVLAANGPSLPSQDALLDSLDTTPSGTFDPVAFLNKHYSNESALTTQLPSLREAVSERMEKLDDRISNALQRQSETAAATRQHVQDAKASVVELEHRIQQIKNKASQSEKAVLEITRDMKRLDCAKRHLQRTITTLKRLHMLVNAVEQLRQTCLQKPFPDYRTAAHLMEATRLLLGHFSGYTPKVQPMRLLAYKVQTYQDTLQRGLVLGFRIVAFGQVKALAMTETKKSSSKKAVTSGHADDDDDDDDSVKKNHPVMSVDVMQGGVLLFDALGDTVRTQFLHEFCQDHLSDYLRDFAPPSRETKPESKRVSSFKVVEVKAEPEKSHTGLDQLEKRFTWFRDLLEQVNVKFQTVFPPKWNLQATMAAMFLGLTRNHILALLDGPRKDPDATNATILLKALQKTILFEKDITVFLQQEFGTVFEESTSTTQANPKKEASAAGQDDANNSDNNTTPPAIPPLIGTASAAYEAYMDPYIRLEEQSMDEQLVEALEDRTVDTRGERPVFISSTNLFVYIKGSITRCTALTKGSAFRLLYQAFKDSLHKYSQILNAKLPSPITTSSSVVGGISIGTSFGGVGKDSSKQKQSSHTAASYRLPAGEEVTVCHVISTCEYCAETTEALEDLIRDTIDDEYKGTIDMMAEQEVFHDTTAKSIRVLVSGLSNRTEAALKAMTALNWGTWDAVGEESSYVRTIHEEIQPMVVTVRGLLPTSYFRSFCDKFAALFISVYHDSLIRLKRISEPGTQQLLLDVYSLKTLLLKLPILEGTSTRGGKKPVATGSTTIAPAMYTKMVQKQFGRIETLLKLVGTPNDLLIDNFKVQWANGKPHDLQAVMNLKGMKRNEQIGYLEKFGLDTVSAVKGVTAGLTGVTIVSERVQALQDQGSTVAAKVNSDLNQMRQKVDDFRKSFR